MSLVPFRLEDTQRGETNKLETSKATVEINLDSESLSICSVSVFHLTDRSNPTL
jgi:hypothetical protein